MSAPMDFRAAGACRGCDPELFFPTRGESTKEAKAVCADCPVMDACRAWAIPNEKVGIWGGLSERERRRVRSERHHTAMAMAVTIEHGAQCESHAAYVRHQKRREPPCDTSKRAHAKYMRKIRGLRRSRQSTRRVA